MLRDLTEEDYKGNEKEKQYGFKAEICIHIIFSLKLVIEKRSIKSLQTMGSIAII